MNSGYTQERLYSADHIKRLEQKENVCGYERLNEKYFKISLKSIPNFSFTEFNSPLLAVGATILSHSKIVLLQCIEFLLKHLDPSRAMLLYLDTDSCFWAVHHPSLEDNVLPSMKASYDLHKDNFVNSNTLLGKKFNNIKFKIYLIVKCFSGVSCQRMGF